jgi:hypothetical protein
MGRLLPPNLLRPQVPRWIGLIPHPGAYLSLISLLAGPQVGWWRHRGARPVLLALRHQLLQQAVERRPTVRLDRVRQGGSSLVSK